MANSCFPFYQYLLDEEDQNQNQNQKKNIQYFTLLTFAIKSPAVGKLFNEHFHHHLHRRVHGYGR